MLTKNMRARSPLKLVLTASVSAALLLTAGCGGGKCKKDTS